MSDAHGLRDIILSAVLFGADHGEMPGADVVVGGLLRAGQVLAGEFELGEQLAHIGVGVAIRWPSSL